MWTGESFGLINNLVFNLLIHTLTNAVNTLALIVKMLTVI